MDIIIINCLIPILAILIGYWYVILQINAMKEIEKEKRIIAIQSLIIELEYNQQIVEGYKQHAEEGNNLGKSGVGYSWEWNSPSFGNYQYLIHACYTDMDLAHKITVIYSKLQACEVIVNYIHQLLASNIQIKNQVINGRNLLQQEVISLNNQLWNIGKEMLGLFAEPIEKLFVIKRSLKELNRQ